MVAILAGVVVGITLLVVRNSAVTVTFPNSLKFGAASASYQIEGAWDEDGKSPNIWDTVTRNNRSYTADGKNGDVAADSYHMWRKDLDALKEIEVSGTSGHRSHVTERIFPVRSVPFLDFVVENSSQWCQSQPERN